MRFKIGQLKICFTRWHSYPVQKFKNLKLHTTRQKNWMTYNLFKSFTVIKFFLHFSFYISKGSYLQFYNITYLFYNPSCLFDYLSTLFSHSVHSGYAQQYFLHRPTALCSFQFLYHFICYFSILTVERTDQMLFFSDIYKQLIFISNAEKNICLVYGRSPLVVTDCIL